MSRIGRIATIACIGLCAATSAWAGARIDLEGGAAPAISSFSAKTEDGLDEKFDVDTIGSYAVGAAWVLDDRLELGGQWQQGFFDDLEILGDIDQDVTLSSATVGARYQLFDREHLVRPYVAGQIGVAIGDATSEEDGLFSASVTRVSRDEAGFGANAGGGVDFQITRLISVGADVRYNYAGVFDDAHYLTTMFNVGIHLG